MYNINSFKYVGNYLKSSLTQRAKSNKFIVRITPPSTVVHNMDGNEFLCENTNFPFYTYNIVDSKYNLKKNKAVNDIDYDPITLSFGIDSGLLGSNHAMEMFLEWGGVIRNENGLYGYPDDYHGIIEIDFLNEYLTPFKTAILEKVFPINLDNLDLDMNSDDLAQLNMSFEYSKISYKSVIGKKDPISFIKSRFAQ